MPDEQQPIILCTSGSRDDCADPHPMRWYCMRGHDGAAPDVCPLEKCQHRGANDGVSA